MTLNDKNFNQTNPNRGLDQLNIIIEGRLNEIIQNTLEWIINDWFWLFWFDFDIESSQSIPAPKYIAEKRIYQMTTKKILIHSVNICHWYYNSTTINVIVVIIRC